jgi:hypothetical protein
MEHLTIKQAAFRLKKDARRKDPALMNAIQARLDKGAGVNTLPFFHLDFLMAHTSADAPLNGLLDVMADVARTAIRRGVAIGTYPIGFQGGKFFMQGDEPTVKLTSGAGAADLFANWGATRLGIATLTITHGQGAGGLQLLVGPWAELRRNMEAHAQRVKRES